MLGLYMTHLYKKKAFQAVLDDLNQKHLLVGQPLWLAFYNKLGVKYFQS